jgi:serine/threonine-protein kinase
LFGLDCAEHFVRIQANTCEPELGMTATPERDPLLGQYLDEYRLEAVLGQGATGRVYRGFDDRLKRPAAIKVIAASLPLSADIIARFEREPRSLPP